MATLCFRRSSGQHFIVFFDSIEEAYALFSGLDHKALDLYTSKRGFVPISDGFYRCLGAGSWLQVIMIGGHHLLDEEPRALPSTWPTHFVAVDKSRIAKYLEWNKTYKLPNGTYPDMGQESGLSHRFYPGYPAFTAPHLFQFHQAHFEHCMKA